MKTYIVYYTDKWGVGGGYEVYGSKALQEALKWLHSEEVKAERIEIYRKGKNFEEDHFDVEEAYLRYWK